MTNKQRQEMLDQSKWLNSEQVGWDKSGAENYCEFCECQVKVTDTGACIISQAEREKQCLCAKAFNKMKRAK